MKQVFAFLPTLAVLFGLFTSASSVSAQGTAFTYQGHLNDGSQAATGSYDLVFGLWSAAIGPTQVGGTVTNLNTAVSNGSFTVTLDFGDQFPGASRWLEIAVRTNGPGVFTTLIPRQKLNAVPYAITAGKVTGSVAAAQLSGQIGGAQIADGAIGSTKVDSNQVQLRVTGVAPAGQFITSINANGTVATASGAAGWNLNGNNVGVGQFLGSTNNQPLELKANDARVQRFEPTGDSVTDANITPDGAPNLIGGASINSVGVNAVGVTIAGGGAADYNNQAIPNSVATDYGTVSGGLGNQIDSNSHAAVISGGYVNAIRTNSPYASIGGGYRNELGTNSFYSRIGGGFDNSIAGGLFAATIAGGRENVIDVASSYSAIGGGLTNYIGANARATVIAGGEFNATSRNSYYDVISGGNSNLIGYNSWNATIAGGHRNIIEGDSYFSSIGGGYFNTIASNSFYATLGGGFANRVGVNSDYGTISGGYANVILTNSSFATIPGGELNAATNYAFAAGRQAKANHTGSFVWADSFNGVLTSSANNQFTVRASGGVRIFSNTATNAGVSLAPGGTSWGVISDRNVKKDFEPADGQDILKKLATMPITHWHYQWEESNTTPHLGPMAQDFKAAFYPGRDDKSITTQEIDGVALAAIQGLNQKVEQTTRDKDAEIHALKERLATLETLVRQMSKAAQK